MTIENPTNGFGSIDLNFSTIRLCGNSDNYRLIMRNVLGDFSGGNRTNLTFKVGYRIFSELTFVAEQMECIAMNRYGIHANNNIYYSLPFHLKAELKTFSMVEEKVSIF